MECSSACLPDTLFFSLKTVDSGLIFLLGLSACEAIAQGIVTVHGSTYLKPLSEMVNFEI